MNKLNLQTLIELYRNKYPPVDFFYLNMYNVAIKVYVNSYVLADKLKQYFKHFLCLSRMPDIEITAIDAPSPDLTYFAFQEKQPDPGKSVIKEEYVDIPDGRIVRKRLTGMVFLFNGCENIVIGPSVANSNQVVNFINNRFIEDKLNEGLLLFHASGVCNEHRGIAISGFSGMGKSTIALHLLNRGVSFVSNDRIMVQDENHGLRMFGVAKYPRINPGTIMHNLSIKSILSQEEVAEYEALSTDELWQTEKKYDLFIEDFYGENKFQITAPMDALFILNWRRNSGEKTAVTEIDITKRNDLYPTFIKMPGLFYRRKSNADHPCRTIDYVKTLAKCQVFEISGDIDFAYLEKKLLDFLN